MSLFSTKKAPRRQICKKVVHDLDDEDESNPPNQSTTADMSLFSKKKAPRRQIRKKVVHDLDDEDESNPPNQSTTNEETSIQFATATPSSVPKSLLSFDDEDLGDGTEFKLKKSSHAKRAAKKLEQQKRKQEIQQVTQKAEDSSDSEQESALSSISHRISTGVIPDSSLIHAARKQRELARKMGTQSSAVGGDVMSLESTSREGGERAKGKSRLVREDEYDKSDESDGEERGKFGRRTEVSRQMQVLAAMEEAGSGSDEERFVEEQINKAVKGCVVTDTQPNQKSHILKQIESEHAPVTSKPVVNIPEILIPITMETLKSSLSQQLSELCSLHRKNENRLEELEGDLVTADQEVGELEQHIGGMSLEYQFYQETHGYLRDLLSCLSEKVPVIEELEGNAHSIMSGVTQLRVERRRQDVRDMSAESAVATPIDHTHRTRVVEREGRQRRRREARREKGVTNHHDGMSSDDELLETNIIKYKNDMEGILSKGKNVFSDVNEDFSDVSTIKTHLEQWKFSFPSSYSQAYISLCLPKLFSPFVRLELLSWNPLTDEGGTLEDARWFNVLMFYGFLEGTEPERDDQDILVIPNIVEKVVLPKVTALVKNGWDPLSGVQTQRLVSLIQSLFDDYPTLSPHNKNGLSLINAVTLKLRQTIDGDVFVPLFAAKQMENPSSPKALFYYRQFWSCLKLLGNITKWVGLIEVDTLQQLVLDGLLNRYLLLSLQNSPVSHLSVDKIAQLVSLVPVAWYGQDGVGARPLEGLVRYTVHLADCLSRAAAGQNDLERSITRSSIQRLVSCLQTVRADSEATSLAQQYNLKQT